MRAEGLALRWVGTGRIFWLLADADADADVDVAAVSDRLVAAARDAGQCWRWAMGAGRHGR